MATEFWFCRLVLAVVWLGLPLLAAGEVKSAFPWDNPFGVVNPWPGIGKIGLGWCRCGGGATQLGDWNTIEPTKDKFVWEAAEAEYTKYYAGKEGLTPSPLLCYTARWASSGPTGEQLYPPKDLFDYFRFVKAAATRFKGRIPAYEIWNEPNGRGTFFAGGCDKLTELVKVGYCAVKRADPNALVIFPGLAGVDIAFAERCYELGARDYFDIMACHPYQWGVIFDEGYQSASVLESLRKLMDHYGDQGKPIWLNEFGWQRSESIKPEDQARLLTIAATFYRSLEHLGVERMFWYNGKSWPGESYGLLDLDGQPTPAFFAYKTVVTNLSGKHYAGQIPLAGARAMLFAPADSNAPMTLVLWSPSLESAAVTIPLKGQETISTKATPMPQFVTIPREKIGRFTKGMPIIRRAGMKVEANQEKFVWAQIAVPPETHLAYVNRGENVLKLNVVNCSAKAQRGTVRLLSPPLKLAKEIAYDVASERSAVVSVPIVIPRSAKFGTYPIWVKGTAGENKLAGYKDRIRVSPGQTVEFTGNSWVESRYLKDGPNGGPSISFGSQWTYQFDLAGCRQARMSLQVGANAGQEWNVEISADGHGYEKLAADRSWPTWRVIDIPEKYLNGKIFLRIRGKEAQLGYFVLDVSKELYKAKEWQ